MGQHPLLNEEKRRKWQAFIQELSPETDPETMQLMDQLRLVSMSLYQVGEHSLAAANLSMPQYRILMHLLFSERDGQGSLNPSEISERQGTSRNTVSALIRNLEDGELVERELDKKDRRKFKIKLTASGREMVHAHVQRHMRIINDCFSELTPEEQTTLRALLTKLRQRVDEKLVKER